MIKTLSRLKTVFVGFLLAMLILTGCGNKVAQSETNGSVASSQAGQVAQTYAVSQEEKAALTEKFTQLSSVNDETIAYIYAPGTNLDEPVVQTTDNETYLDKTFEGGHQPEFGTVFMDMDNSKNFDDSLTWLFGHARGSQVPDSRMFNDVNYYDDQKYFDEHPYVVVQTPERTYYYEAAFLIIVPETTAFYQTEFESEEQFYTQLTEVAELAHTKNPKVTISPSDKYLVLSTCREDDVTIRSNLYLRQIPDAEIPQLLAQHGEQLAYVPTR